MSTLEDRLGFFVGAYFKIGSMDLLEMGNNDIAKRVICKCVDKAYQDLKRRIPYKYSNSKVKDLGHEEKVLYCNLKKDFYQEISEIICSYLVVREAYPLDVIDIKNINPSEIIEDVIECAKKYQMLFKEDTTFTVGLAQKWVNMTLKYLWILGVLDDEYDENLDVPIDSYILVEVAKLGIDIKNIKWSSWNSLSEYKEIQTTLKKVVLEEQGCTSIRWENEKWINAICAKE
jgi:hypothetical protein